MELDKKSTMETKRQDDLQKRRAQQLSLNPRCMNNVHVRVGMLSSFHHRTINIAGIDVISQHSL